MQYVTLSCSPCEEEGAQLGADYFMQDSKIESAAYIGQLQRLFPNAKDAGISFVVKNFEHDFGVYPEIVCEFDEANEVATSAAYDIENQIPDIWDIVALNEMAQSLAKLIAPESERAPGQRYAWMNTLVVEVQQGRELLRLIRKVRRGAAVSPNEALCYLTAEAAA
jgi:hypothetical protein